MFRSESESVNFADCAISQPRFQEQDHIRKRKIAPPLVPFSASVQYNKWPSVILCLKTNEQGILIFYRNFWKNNDRRLLDRGGGGGGVLEHWYVEQLECIFISFIHTCIVYISVLNVMASKGALTQFIQNYHRSNIFFTIAGISGALAIGLGAYGSHGKFVWILYKMFLTWMKSLKWINFEFNIFLLGNISSYYIAPGKKIFCNQSCESYKKKKLGYSNWYLPPPPPVGRNPFFQQMRVVKHFNPLLGVSSLKVPHANSVWKNCPPGIFLFFNSGWWGWR